MWRVPDRRTLPSICRTSTTLNVSSVPCMNGPKCILAPDESRPARAHLSGVELLDDRLPRPDRPLPRAAPRRRRPHQPRRRRRQPPPRRPAGRGGHRARSRRRDLDPVRRLSRLLDPTSSTWPASGTCRPCRQPARSPSTRPWSGPTRPRAAAAADRSTTRAWPSRSRCSSTPSRSGTATGPTPSTSTRRRASPTTCGLPATGGSDAHRAERIGLCATEIEGDVRSTADVVAAIKAGTVSPVAPVAPQNGGRRAGHLLDLFRR